MKHLRRKQRKPCSKKASEDSIRCDSRCRKLQVYINDIIEALQENHEDAPANGDTGEDLGDPGYVGRGGPAEPEETGGQEQRTDDHGRESFFRDDFVVVFSHFAGESGLGHDGDGDGAEGGADYDGDEGEGAHASVPVALFLKGDGVCFEEEVEDSVDEGELGGLLAFCGCGREKGGDELSGEKDDL